MNAILLSFVISLAVNAVFFAIAAIRRTDVVTDLSYSLSFALLAIALPSLGAREPVQLVAALLVLTARPRVASLSRLESAGRRFERSDPLHRHYDVASRPHRISGCSRFVTNCPASSVAQ